MLYFSLGCSVTEEEEEEPGSEDEEVVEAVDVVAATGAAGRNTDSRRPDPTPKEKEEV